MSVFFSLETHLPVREPKTYLHVRARVHVLKYAAFFTFLSPEGVLISVSVYRLRKIARTVVSSSLQVIVSTYKNAARKPAKQVDTKPVPPAVPPRSVCAM